MKGKINDILLFIVVLLIIVTVVLMGCNSNSKKSDTVGAGPTVEDMSDEPIDKEVEIRNAISTCERIMADIEEVPEIQSSVTYINHESVLVALKLKDNYNNISPELRMEVEKKVKDIYSNAKTIAISDDEYVYESIAKLLKSFKENKPLEEFKKDLEEIIENM
ncbi:MULTISPECIES: YhcN/YlaJ family sporulation lipoprotein [unclassified Clostridium]|uniref:YhcN/YlaJ family sporulation lipoprotein n=1 Tax=unclassified Clostridium TaxID=2614128 RepID=UPI003216FA81